jgi:hypothetical protein
MGDLAVETAKRAGLMWEAMSAVEKEVQQLIND